MCLYSHWFSQMFLKERNSTNFLCKMLNSLLRIKLNLWLSIKYSNIIIFLIIGTPGIILQSLCINSPCSPHEGRIKSHIWKTSRNPYAVVSYKFSYYFFRFLHITWTYQGNDILISDQTTFSWAPKTFIKEVAKIPPGPLNKQFYFKFLTSSKTNQSD